MNKIIFFFGPKCGFSEIVPDDHITLYDFIREDDKNKAARNMGQTEPDRKTINNLVAYSESYSMITDGAVQGFISITSSYEINNIYFQNPPNQIKQQFEQAYPGLIEIKKYTYQHINLGMFKKINEKFSEKIIGQEIIKEELLIALYKLVDKTKMTPVVLMLYGPSGVGKTETARFLSEILGQELFRKQLSMLHSGEYFNYIFGGSHSQGSFARDLLERESNVILLDEFDKPNSIFHSAFYQMFDEGVFVDRNYNVELYDSIIICTSNFQSEEEIRRSLGDPLFYRFNKFIKYSTLSIESLEIIIGNNINKLYSELSDEEQKQVDKENIKSTMFRHAAKLRNARQISKIVEEFIGMDLVKYLLNSSEAE